jgi:curved DNA-binding protein CbpA
LTAFDPYAELDVDRDAPKEQIRRAFRAKAKRAHPDAGGSRDEFERLKRAALVLTDDRRRARFDSAGVVDDSPDDTQGQARGLLAAKLLELLAGAEDPLTFDAIGRLRFELRKRRSELVAQIAKVSAGAKRAEALKSALRGRKGKAIVEALLGDHLAKFRQAVGEGESQVAVVDAAIEMLRDVEVDFAVGASPFSDLAQAATRASFHWRSV